MEERLEKEIRKKRWHKTWNVIALLLVMLVIGAVAFSYFHVTTQARLICRRGKNVKLALDMLDVELYAEKKTIYDAKKPGGMARGIAERVYDIVEQEGEIQILSYDQQNRMITGLLYEEDQYRVTYRYDTQKGDCWRVDYLIGVLDYSN